MVLKNSDPNQEENDLFRFLEMLEKLEKICNKYVVQFKILGHSLGWTKKNSAFSLFLSNWKIVM